MANSTSQSKCFFDLEQVKPYPRYPYAFAQCDGEDCYEYELEQKSRRVILLFVPDDGSNYFTQGNRIITVHVPIGSPNICGPTRP